MLQKLRARLCPALGFGSHDNPATQPSTSVPPRLPVELVRDIIDLTLADLEQFPNRSQWRRLLCKYCLVHSTWRAYVQPILFQSIRLTLWNFDVRHVVRNLKSNKKLLKTSVKRIEMGSFRSEYYARSKVEWGQGAKLVSELATHCPQLQTLAAFGIYSKRFYSYSGGFRSPLASFV